jgi:hypothetical protein
MTHRDEIRDDKLTLDDHIRKHVSTGHGTPVTWIDSQVDNPVTHAVMRSRFREGRYYYWLRDDGAFSVLHTDPCEAKRSAIHDSKMRLGDDPA